MTPRPLSHRVNEAHRGSAPLSLVFVRHKAGSIWINRIIAEAASIIGWHFGYFWDRAQHGYGPHDYDLKSFLAQLDDTGKQPFVVTCANLRRDDVRSLRSFRAFHVIRDPRDTIVSAYFSHRNSHPFPGQSDWARHQQRLRSVSRDEGLLYEIEFSERYLSQLRTWDFELPQVLELKFEEITASPYDTFLRAVGFIGLLDEQADSTLLSLMRRVPVYVLNRMHTRHPVAAPFRFVKQGVPGDELVRIVYGNRFVKASGGRALGEEDPNAHYRKGVPGDWVNYFRPAHRLAFVERYGDLVERLGYEPTSDWRAAD